MKREICLLLHDIRSVYNVGAIFRTADAIGATKIYLTGFTPAPLDRFNQPRQDFAKSALGSELTMPWEYAKSPTRLIARLKKEGFQVVSVEQAKNSVDYKSVTISDKCLVVLGNEVEGVAKAILSKSDVIAELPMKGQKESLNVSVTAGVVLYRWFDN
jgi:23S rRNA (guanosine2251-2'-O)-methyltransferase